MKYLLAGLLCLMLVHCATKSHQRSNASHELICETRSVMATAWKICLSDPGKTEVDLRAYMEEGFAELRRIDEWMSEWKEKSLVSEINRNAGLRPVALTDEAYTVLKLCLDHSRLTGGAFDISFNVFFGKYSWKPGLEKFPTGREISKLLPLVNYKHISLNEQERTVFLQKKGMKIGLGGMGQGWAVDKVVELMRGRGVAGGFVDGSGDTFFWGEKEPGALWTVGVGDPRPSPGQNENQAWLYKMYLSGAAVTTAGDTEKFFIRGGKRYHHIIDPKSGQSANKSAQVTVICPNATLCDLVDGGVFILGGEAGIAYAHKVGVEAVVIEPNKNIWLTKGLKPTVTQWGPTLELRKSSFYGPHPTGQ